MGNLARWFVALAPLFAVLYGLSESWIVAAVGVVLMLLLVGAFSEYALLSRFSSSHPPLEAYSTTFENVKNEMLLRGVLPTEGLSVVLLSVPEPRPFVTLFRTLYGKMGIVASQGWLTEKGELELRQNFEHLIQEVCDSRWVLPTTGFIFLRFSWWGLGGFRTLFFPRKERFEGIRIQTPVRSFLRFVIVLPYFRLMRWLTRAPVSRVKSLEHGIDLLI